MAKTSIEWAQMVWNPVTGCTKVSQGCKNCYAKALHDMRHKAYREGKKVPTQYGRPFERPLCHPERVEDPIHWIKPRRIFVNSMSDLFHEAVYDQAESFLDEIFAVMAATPRHTYMVLTKRAVIMRNYMTHPKRVDYVEHALETIYGEHGWCAPDFTWPLPNVWLGVSTEDQQAADERIPLLLKTPAAVRFISAEPLLGPIDLDSEKANGLHALGCGEPSCPCGDRGIDWVITGGESGPGARPMHPDWAQGLRDQCQAAGVKYFHKQNGEWLHRSQVSPMMQGDLAMSNVFGRDFQYHQWDDGSESIRVGKKAAGRLLDGCTWDEFPDTAKLSKIEE